MLVKQINQPVDTIIIYLNAERHQAIAQDVLSLKPRRIIFNSGTEPAALIQYYQHHGNETLEACSLVMLRTDQFE